MTSLVLKRVGLILVFLAASNLLLPVSPIFGGVGVENSFPLFSGGITNVKAADSPEGQLQNLSSYSSGNENEFTSWSGWGHDLLNSRFQPFTGQLNKGNVNRLGLKWTFVFPDATAASNQPTVLGDTLYMGSWNAKFYALNAQTGQLKWSYDTRDFTGNLPPGTLPPGFNNAVRNSPAVAGGLVYFGDVIGDMYALNAETGAVVWAKRIDSHPTARITGSPVVYRGRVYQGVSGSETANTLNPAYPCCTFRGSMVALNARTGGEVWRYYTSPVPQQVGVNSIGTPLYGPSGAPVWSTPAIDPLSQTLYFGSGQSYSLPASPLSDSVIAVDVNTGVERWHNQLTPNDRWNIACDPSVFGLPPGPQPNCPQPSANDKDFDFGAAPTLFVTFDPKTYRLRTLVGAGQKSGIYHALDARTGEIVWQTEIGLSTVQDGLGGIQWGSSWDGERLYVSTNQANPGTLFALNPANGKILWKKANPLDGCSTGGAVGDTNCKLALPAPATTIPGVVFEGSADGKLRGYNSQNGSTLWQYDTRQNYTGTNGIQGQGGSINGSGVTVARNGMVYVGSGYLIFPRSGMSGNVLLAFGL